MLYIIPHPLKRPAEKQFDLLYATLDLHGIEYVISKPEDVPKYSTVITDCFLMHNPDGELGHLLAESIFEKCDTCKIVFYYPSESYATLSASFEPTAKVMTERNIESHLIKCGDWDVPGFTTNSNLPEFFAWIINNDFNRARLPYTQNLIDTKVKTHKFLFLNGEYRVDREYLYGLYERSGLLSNSLYSHRGGKGDAGIAPTEDWEDPFIHPDFRFYAYYPSHFYNTKISVISETTQMEFFPTEKTYKSLMLGHPFFLFGGKNSLQKIRNLGFQTFGDVLDESYDLAEYPRSRAEKLIECIEKCPDDIHELTVAQNQHNRKHFLAVSNSIYGKLLNILLSIDKTIIINESFNVNFNTINKYFLN
jgi:hypothetical protein